MPGNKTLILSTIPLCLPEGNKMYNKKYNEMVHNIPK